MFVVIGTGVAKMLSSGANKRPTIAYSPTHAFIVAFVVALHCCRVPSLTAFLLPPSPPLLLLLLLMATSS